MAVQLEDIIERSHPARLIPVVADSKKEERATSILLAAFSIVPIFAHNVLVEAGARIGKRSDIKCFTEVTFPLQDSDSKARPDGLIVITQGKKTWSALVESKIGSSDLTSEQVETYLDIAKVNGIDAVITISNQYASDPQHHPVKVSKVKTRSVGLFHFSWTSILSRAYVISESQAIEDPEQAFIMKEVVRYYSHESSGVSAFTKLHGHWKDVCETIHSQGSLTKTSDIVQNSASSWIQLGKYLSLKLSMLTQSTVSVVLTKRWKNNYADYFSDTCDQLTQAQYLTTQLDIPNTASPISIHADFTRRTITFSMTVKPPQDKLRPTAALNWLTRQFKGKNQENVLIRANWGRGVVMIAPLDVCVTCPDMVIPSGAKTLPASLDVVMILELNARFKATKSLVDEIETNLPDYYDKVGRHLIKWIPKPPKITPMMEESDTDKDFLEKH
jgi:hypothetical protein